MCDHTVIEMVLSLIRVKCCVQADIPCFSDLVIILYDEVLRLGTDHDRVEFVFSSYFNSLNAKVAIIQKLVN